MSLVRRNEQRRRLQRWAISQAQQSLPVVRLELLLVEDDQQTVPVCSWDAPFGDPADTMAAVFRAADEDAANEERTRTYRVIAFDTHGAMIDSRDFAVDAQGRHYFGPDAERKNTEAAAFAAIQRHADMSARHSVETFKLANAREARIDGHYERIIASQQAEIDKLRAKYLEAFELVEELSSKKQEREIAMLGELRRDKQITELFAQGKALLPLIVAKAGRKPGESTAYAGKELLDALLDKILSRPERFDAIGERLEADEKALILELAMIRKAEHEAAAKREHEARSAANGAAGDDRTAAA